MLPRRRKDKNSCEFTKNKYGWIKMTVDPAGENNKAFPRSKSKSQMTKVS